MKVLNIGILAHVDAGKTSLTERLLYNAGVLKELGSVDKGTTNTDTLDLERQRGITYEPLDPITEYSRYALMKGTYSEQGAFVEGIESQFVIRNQTLEIIEKKD